MTNCSLIAIAEYTVQWTWFGRSHLGLWMGNIALSWLPSVVPHFGDAPLEGNEIAPKANGHIRKWIRSVSSRFVIRVPFIMISDNCDKKINLILIISMKSIILFIFWSIVTGCRTCHTKQCRSSSQLAGSDSKLGAIRHSPEAYPCLTSSRVPFSLRHHNYSTALPAGITRRGLRIPFTQLNDQSRYFFQIYFHTIIFIFI